MFEFDQTFSDISSSSSVSSLDFTELEEFQLLSRSLSLEALPVITDEYVPPFNDVPPFPLNRRLFPNDDFLKTPRRATIILDSDDKMRITLTLPTTPRMTNVLKEPRVIDSSAGNQTMNFEVYEHLAWEDTETTPYYREALGVVAPVNRALNKRRASERSSSFRDALVFEHDVMYEIEERARRWSLDVPVTSMNQEMVDMMVELHNLNSFFKAGLEDLDQSVVVLEERKERPEPPSLMISNSHCAIPISLESSENLVLDPPLSLAARRGKDHLPPLLVKTLKHNALMTEYPSIPTAFLGSPSVYSPKFEYANTADDPSLDLEDMISSLRSQCASIHSDSQGPVQTEDLIPATMDLSADSWTQSCKDNDDAEWAFANSFLRNLGASARDSNSIQNPHTNNHAIGPREPSPAYSQGTPTWGSKINPTSYGTIRSPPRGPPPSTPPPPLPSPSSPSSPHKVRGILKNSKNVRFASLPVSTSAGNVEIPLSRRRQSMALVPVDRPKRLRPKSNTIAGSAPPLVLPRTHGTTPSPATKDAKHGGDRPMSVPSSNHSDGFRSRAPITPGQARTPLTSISRQSTPAQKPPAQKPTHVSVGRHSLGRSIKAEINKEPDGTKGRASHTPNLSRRWTNENNFCRRSDASQVTPKSRMPVPLRNILTRFK